MQQDPYLKCPCEKCGAPIEFPVEGRGQSVSCPHCGENTNLREVKQEADWIKNPSAPPLQKSKSILLIVLSCVVLAIAMGLGIFAASKSSKPAPPTQDVSETKPKDEDDAPRNDRRKRAPGKRAKVAARQVFEWKSLKATDVALEKSDASRLIYATGAIHNNSDRQRFGVKVELELFDAQDAKLGSAADYVQVIEKDSDWKFKALVTDAKAVRAKVISISEE